MKKIFKNLLLLFLFIPFLNVKAASGIIDIYSSNKNPAPGNTFTVTVYCKSSSTIGTCEYTLNYDSSKVKFISANDTNSCNDTFCSYYAGNKETSKKFTFKAIANGTTTISAKSVGIIGMDEKSMTTSVSPVNITIATPKPAAPIVYSTNNYLSSLSIEGQNISPKFDKNKNDYTITLDSNVEEITIKATKEDSKAKINGIGTKKVSEGENKFNIVVTSEKGTKRTYTLTVTIEDKNPIKVNIDDKEYTIIKRKSVLTKPENYIDKEILINNTPIPAFYNENNNYTLVGLKDSEGKTNLYIYNEKDNTYTLYKEFSFNNIKLLLKNPNKTFDKYIKTNITIGEEIVTCYKLNENSKWALIYGTNIETNETNWYVYEEDENTVQKYDESLSKIYEEEITKLKDFILLLGGIILFLSILIIIVCCIKTKKKSKKKKNTKKEKNL